MFFTRCKPRDHSFNVFTARRYASTVYAMALCPSVCLSVTSQCFTKTAQHNYSVARLPKDSIVFWRQRSRRNSTGVTPSGGAQLQAGYAKIDDIRRTARYITKTIQDRRIVSTKVEYEVGPLKYSYEVWGSAVSSLSGVLVEPQRKSNFVYFSLKI